MNAQLSRRQFLEVSAATGAFVLASSEGLGLVWAQQRVAIPEAESYLGRC